jgi:hypothetical protein
MKKSQPPVSSPDCPKFSGAAFVFSGKILLADVQGKSINDCPLSSRKKLYRGDPAPGKMV